MRRRKRILVICWVLLLIGGALAWQWRENTKSSEPATRVAAEEVKGEALQPVEPPFPGIETSSQPKLQLPESAEQLPMIDERLQQRIETAVRLYASYPSKQGRDALLAELKPLVSDTAHAAIAQEWSGPEVTTVDVNVTNVLLEEIFIDSEGRPALQAHVTQEATFANTPNQTYLTYILVTLEPRGKDWTIVNLQEMPA